LFLVVRSIIEVAPGEWRVVHGAVEDIVSITDWEYYGAEARVLEVRIINMLY
jgi:hypothetical protein